MADRQKSRQASRRGERKARQRLAKRYGSMVKSGMVMRKLPMYAADKFVTCKFIRNTQARFCNRKRCPDWITPTVQHLVADTSEHHPEDQQVSAGHRHRI